jgi:hypothetical protein
MKFFNKLILILCILDNLVFSKYYILNKNTDLEEIKDINKYIRNKYNIVVSYIITDYCNISDKKLYELNLTNDTAINDNYWIVKYTDNYNLRYFKCFKNNEQITAVFSLKYNSTFISKFFGCKIYPYEY